MAYTRNQKHRNQSDTNTRKYESAKSHYPRKKRLTREDYQVPGNARAILVPDGDINQALKRFRKMMKIAGIIDELKAKQRYEKPSKVKYEAKKRITAITSMNDIRNIKSESKYCWVAIVNGKAQ